MAKHSCSRTVWRGQWRHQLVPAPATVDLGQAGPAELGCRWANTRATEPCAVGRQTSQVRPPDLSRAGGQGCSCSCFPLVAGGSPTWGGPVEEHLLGPVLQAPPCAPPPRRTAGRTAASKEGNLLTGKRTRRLSGPGKETTWVIDSSRFPPKQRPVLKPGSLNVLSEVRDI